MQQSRRSRRCLLTIAATGLASIAGCIDTPFGDDGPESKRYDVILEESAGDVTASVDPAGDVEDVIQVRVGDDVTFEIDNRRETPTVFHNHVPHEEVTIPAGESASMTFTPAESQIGTHEVEVFDADEANTAGEGEDGHDDDGHEDDGHEDDDHDDEDGHAADDVFVILTVEVRPSGT